MLPLCQYPGCDQRVKHSRCRYCSPGHVPQEVLVARARKGRKSFAYRKRMEVFHREIAQLAGRTVTREDLLEVFKRISLRSYNAGWQACKKGYRSYVEDVA